VPLWRATTISTYFRFLQVLFRSIDVIAYVFCHAGVLVCLFVVTCEFLYDVIETWLSNSKLHYEILVPSFWLLSFAWDPSISFQSLLLQLLFCLLLPLWNSFVSVVIVIDFFFVFRSGTTDFAKAGQVSDDTINLINYQLTLLISYKLLSSY